MSRRLIFCLVMTLSFLVLVGTISALSPDTVQQEQAAENAPNSANGYIIKNFRGKVAVFRNGDEIPINITDTEIDSLPDFDNQQLQIGVYAANERELKRLLEDYCS